MAVTHRTLDYIKETISAGKSLIEDPEKVSTPECEAWKVKCLYAIKQLANHNIPDVSILENECSPYVALAHLQNASQSVAFWLKQQENKPKPETKQGKVILCLHCGNKTYMDKVSTYSYKDEDYHVWSINTWNMFFCPVCLKITLEHTFIFSEECDVDEYGNYGPIRTLTTLYPHPSVTIESGIPTNIRKAFEAAQKIRHIDGAVCALSLRRTLEMVCKDKGETEGSLFKKLQNLSQKGILPPILDQIATVLRELGNVAAHADDVEYEFPSELVPDLIEFTDIILNYLYVLPAKIQDIQSKMNDESNKPPSDSTDISFFPETPNQM